MLWRFSGIKYHIDSFPGKVSAGYKALTSHFLKVTEQLSKKPLEYDKLWMTIKSTILLQGFECPQLPITSVRYKGLYHLAELSSKLAPKPYLHFNCPVKQKTPRTICGIKMSHLGKCTSLEADQLGWVSRLTCYLPYGSYVCSCGLSLCTWNASGGINLDPAHWIEVGHLQQHLSVAFRAVTAQQGFCCLARKRVHHSLSTKQGQWSILQLHTLSPPKVQLPFSKRTLQWVSYQTPVSYRSGQRVESGQRSKNWF